MYKTRSEQMYDMSLDDLLTRLKFAAEDMRNACHPDHYDQANSLAWEIMNVIAHHKQSPWGTDSKFKKAPYIDPNTGKSLLDSIRERKAKTKK